MLNQRYLSQNIFYFLPNSIYEFTITWTSSRSEFLDGYQIVGGLADTSLQLTATIHSGESSINKLFNVTILQDQDLYDEYIASLQTHVDRVIEKVTLLDSTTTNLSLPQLVDSVSISWSSDSPNILSNSGVVFRPIFEVGNIIVKLTATYSYFEIEESVDYFVTVVAEDEVNTDEIDLAYLTNTTSGFLFNYSIVTSNLFLPNQYQGIAIEWESTNQTYLSNEGIVTRPEFVEGDIVVTFIATFSYNNVQLEKQYDITIKALEPTYMEYYIGIGSLEGEALKQFLHDLIDDHIEFSYASLWTALAQTDEDPNNPNNVILFYTGRSQDKDAHGGNADDWNREHVWAKSHGDFGDAIGPGTDMHHIRPTDASVNSARSNLDFDNGGTIVYDGSTPTENYKDSDSFEPRDEVKGDVARMIFYMAVRYEGDDGWPDLEINDLVNNSGPYMGKLSTLLEWHLEDPPDEFEQNRNEVIFSFQGNRNPFIDYPELVELIWGE